MLFHTDDLNKEYNSRNTLNLLESMYRIDRVWSKHTPASIPLMESKEYGAFMARYSDLLKLSEEYDASIQECLDAVIYENHLRPNEVIVSLEEWRPYVDPLILHRFSNNYVLVPEINTPAYRLCEVCMESFLETGDSNWLDIYTEAPMINILQEIADMSKAPTKKQRNALIQLRTSWENKLRALEKEAEENEKLPPYKRTRTTEDIQKDYKSIENQIKSINTRLAQTENSPEAKLAAIEKEETPARLQKTDTSSNSNDNNEPSWLAQKWMALKNWWNNTGQADDKGNVGWFSNFVGKIKNALGFGNKPTTATTNNTQQTTAQPAEKTTTEQPKQNEKPATTDSTNNTQQTTAQPAEKTTTEQPKPEEKSTTAATTNNTQQPAIIIANH